MMHRLLGILLCLTLLGPSLFAQPQNTQRFHWWHFGDGWTLNFNTTPPSHDQSSSINQFEGCATVSDGAGRLLFYTDGMTVWQSNGQPMTNGQGLLGDDGSTMSAIITPVIGNREQYYIFTVDGSTTLPNNGPNGRFDGLHYSVVDMSLNGGRGQVIQKNIPLVDSTTEKVIALKGANEREYWVVTQLFDKSRYHAYKVDCSGINTTPVISNSGLPVSGTISYGYMKPSHDGNMIASIVTDTSFFGINERVELLDFDRNTGLLSNPRPVTGVGAAFYGLEFSPNDSVLYVGDITNQEILSFDLLAANIPGTRQIVHSYGFLGADIGALQLGPDSVIYIKKFNTLDAVENPDDRNNPQFSTGVVNLQNASLFNPTLGLPAWFDIWPAPLTAPDTTICKGYSAPIGLTPLPGFTYTWSPTNSLSNPNIANPIASPTTTTTYTLLATYAGCTDTASVTVTVLGDTTFISSSLGHFDWCPNRPNTLRLNGAIPVQWIKDDTVLTGENGITTLVTGPGTYQAAVTDSCGNPDTLSVTVAPNPPDAFIAPDDTLIICQGDLQPLFAQGGQVIQWLRNGQPLPGTNPVRVATQAGWYEVIVEDTCGLRDTAGAWLQYWPPLNITFNVGDTTLLCPGGNATLIGSGGNPVQWLRNNVAIPGATDSLLTINQTGNYSLIMTGPNGCADTGTVAVISYATLDSLIQTPDTALCLGDSIQLRTIGGGAFSWQPTAGVSCTNCPQPFVAPTQTTTYTVTLTDPLGCSVTDSVTLSILPLPQINSTPDTALCPGVFTTLQASGGASYQWQPANGLSCTACPSPVAQPNSPTTYTVIGTDTNGCRNTATTQIALASAPTVQVMGADSVCQGDSITLLASGAIQYSWSGTSLGCTHCPDPTVSPDSTSIYQVIGTNTQGCSDTTTVEVFVFAAQSLGLTNDTSLCRGDSIGLSFAPSLSAQQITWTPASDLSCHTCPDPIAFPAASLTYTVEVITNQGCILQDSIHIDVVSPSPLTTSPDTTICVGNIGELRVSGAQTYSWQPGTGLSCTTCPNPTIQPQTTTTYTVQGTDQNGCTSEDSVSVTVTPGPPMQLFGGSSSLCEGDTVSLQAQGASTYQWAPIAGLSCYNCPDPQAYPTQTTTYTVQGSDGNGCSSFDSLTLAVVPEPIASLSGDTAICRGDTATWIIDGVSSPLWQPVSSVSCATCDTIVISPANTQTFTLTGIGNNGCPIDTAFRLQVETPPNLTVSLSSPAACAGESIQLVATGAVQYQWSPATGLDCTNCDTVVATPDSSIVYTISGQTLAGCTNTIQAPVTIWPLPDLLLTGDTTLCEGDSLPLTTGTSYTHTWSSLLPLSCTGCPSPTVVAAQSGTVRVAVTDNNGCTTNDSLRISTYPLPVITAGPDTTLCEGDTLSLRVLGASTYSWQPTASLIGPLTANPQAIPLQSTTYTVTGEDGNGCISTENVVVTVSPAPFVDAGPDVQLFEGESGVLAGQGTGAPLWSPARGLDDPGVFTPGVSFLADTQQYVLQVTDAIGCSAQDSVTVIVLAPEIITVPNAFTPNGDGQNDYFTIPALRFYELISLQIYNRWGELVFQTEQHQPGWNGRINGSPAPPGVYTYIIQLRSPMGLPIQRQGNVTLLR